LIKNQKYVILEALYLGYLMTKSKIKLGQLLTDRDLITPEQLARALEQQKSGGGLLGQVLIDLQFVQDESVLLPSLADQQGVDFLRLRSIKIPPEVIGLLPAQLVTYYKVIPVKLEEDVLTVATARPMDISMIDGLGLEVDYCIDPVLTSEKDIQEAIRAYYGVGADTIEQMMDRNGQAQLSEDKVTDIGAVDAEASISKFLNQILLEAYKDRATDIHIEPFVDELRVRYRIDGLMYDAKVPKNIRFFKDAISSRIKILSNLNIAEKRLPQDGRFKVRIGVVDLDLRVSFLPTPSGEGIVLRILNATRLFRMEELGLSKKETDILDTVTKKTHGIIFLTGPTGSGKTTTLYACLARMNTDEYKIITIEDPIEYQLKGITQVQINPSIGLTFAQGLRSMLRHDPDIMMVGEVRDKETATTAVQVALTGHLIFSTLHTNDSAGGVARLLDMGIEPYLITSTVQCFIAQRLVRKLCIRCRKSSRLSPAMAREFGEEMVGTDQGIEIYERQGCDACHQTGYSGREAIYEFLVITDDLRQLILQRATADEIKARAMVDGMTTLRQSGWEKVKQGLTTLQEVMRVTYGGA